MASHAPRFTWLVLVVLFACSPGPKLELASWSLVVGGGRGDGRDILLPTRLDDGRVPAEPGRYRLHAHVTLPAAWRGQALQLVLPDLAAIAKLRVDDTDAVDLATSSRGGYRRRGPHSWAISEAATADGVLDLELVVDHRWTQSAWWGTVPRLLPRDQEDSAATAVYVFNFLVAGAALIALCQIAFASLVIYVADRRRRVYLPFGVQGMLAAYYPMFVAGWTQPVFGVYDAPVLAITLAVACTMSIQFTHDFFSLPGRPWRGYWWLCAGVCVTAIAFSDPFVATRVTGIATVSFVSLVMAHQVTTCTRLVLRNPERRSAVYTLIAWLGLLVTGGADFTWWLGLGDLFGGIRLASIGLALFAVMLSLLLSQRHIHSLRKSDALNAELEERIDQLEQGRAEIEQLNVELRRQIADRAAQIYAAVALASTRGRIGTLVTGDVIQGRYRVERPLGAGGMGTIYEVTRLVDGRRFALKVPQEVHGESLARLAREAQMAATLAHPNLVAVVDVDVASAGFLFLVMELVEGTSLDGLRHRYGDIGWALPILCQITDGLTALHRVGIVHRDLKPSNILITDANEGVAHIKISDFGLSLHPESERLSQQPAGDSTSELDVQTVPMLVNDRPTKRLVPDEHEPAAVAASSFLTRTGQVPGTPVYMAPELVDGRGEVTAAADMFALGVLAHELLSGSRPFSEPPVFALIARRAYPLPKLVEEVWPACPPDLARALDACLALAPAARPTAAELARLLAAASQRVAGDQPNMPPK